MSNSVCTLYGQYSAMNAPTDELDVTFDVGLFGMLGLNDVWIYAEEGAAGASPGVNHVGYQRVNVSGP